MVMTEYAWPGNVRELENIVEMLSITTQDNIIDVKHLPDKLKKRDGQGSGNSGFYRYSRDNEP